MYGITDRQDGRCVGVTVHGKLVGDDLRAIDERLEAHIKRHGAINMLVELADFKGWDLEGFFLDLKFDFKHNQEIERIAIVGDERWERWMTKLMQLFAHAQVRYFDRSAVDEAWRWICAPVEARP